MSYYSYIINKENKTYYCLGKGCFTDLSFEIEVGALRDPEYLAEFLFDDVFQGYELKDPDNLREYCVKFANELCEFTKGSSKDNIFVFTDCGDDLWAVRCLGYKCVGSRYGEEDITNKHLDPSRQHMYNVDLLLKPEKTNVVIGNKVVCILEEESRYKDLYERYK